MEIPRIVVEETNRKVERVLAIPDHVGTRAKGDQPPPHSNALMSLRLKREAC
jgi:hypothetical protein